MEYREECLSELEFLVFECGDVVFLALCLERSSCCGTQHTGKEGVQRNTHTLLLAYLFVCHLFSMFHVHATTTSSFLVKTSFHDGYA